MMSGTTIYGQPITHFQYGWIEGYWNFERLQHCGWQSASDCLHQMELNYQQGIERLTDWTDQEAAHNQYELLTGKFKAEQLTLNQLIEEGY